MDYRIALACFVMVTVAIMPTGMMQAWGHGLGVDATPTITVGDISMTINAEIPSYYNETDRRQVVITAVDRETGEGVPDITYDMAILHGGQELYRERMYAPQGVTIMDFRWNEGMVETSGGLDSARGAFYGTLSEPLQVGGPVFDAGLYSFEISQISVGGMAGPPDAYSADVTIVGTATFMQEDSEGEDVKFRTKSYFDDIVRFTYDPVARGVYFEMPFDWSESSISHVPVVHEEVHFPKGFAEFFAPGYTGQVNGIDLFKSSITVDDYTEEDERIVHFVLTTDQIRHIKNQLRQAGVVPGDAMVFTLGTADQVEFPVSAWTRDEQFQVDLSWDPVVIAPETRTKFVFTIRDGATAEPLRNSAFDFVIRQDGAEIYRERVNAQVGGYFADYTFGEEQTGQTAIRFEDIRGTGLSTEFVVMVVPEFGLVAMAVLGAGTILAVILAGRHAALWHKWT